MIFLVCGLALEGIVGSGLRFGGMECRSSDGLVGRHKFAMGVGSFSARTSYAAWERGALGQRGIGKFWAARGDLFGLSCVGYVRRRRGALI